MEEVHNPFLEGGYEWELVSPEGVVEVKTSERAPRLDTLGRKVIGLRWNGKPNGDVFLDRLAELLAEKVPTANIIKFYGVEPSTATYTGAVGDATKTATLVKSYAPDIVISSQGD